MNSNCMLSLLTQVLSRQVNTLATKKQSRDVSKLLSRILKRHLEEVKILEKNELLEFKLNIEEIVQWDVWPNLMKFTCKL